MSTHSLSMIGQSPPPDSWCVWKYKGGDEYIIHKEDGSTVLFDPIKWCKLGGRFPHELDPTKPGAIPPPRPLPDFIYRCTFRKGVGRRVVKVLPVPAEWREVYGTADLRAEWRESCWHLWRLSHVRNLPYERWDELCAEHPDQHHCRTWLAWDARYGSEPMPAVPPEGTTT